MVFASSSKRKRLSFVAASIQISGFNAVFISTAFLRKLRMVSALTFFSILKRQIFHGLFDVWCIVYFRNNDITTRILTDLVTFWDQIQGNYSLTGYDHLFGMNR